MTVEEQKQKPTQKLPKRQTPFDIVTKGVEFWTGETGAHIIEYDSINKETFHLKWQIDDDTKFDYKSNLQAGLYDYGFAVRTGFLHRGKYKGCYLDCIDFDTLEAFLTWCGEDYNLDSLAIWTRVEWHKDRLRIHVFIISKSPLKDLARSDKNKFIEVYGEKPHLVCVCGYHADGNLIEPYNTKEIAVIDNIKKLEIESRIKAVIPSYLSDDDNGVSKYVEELEKPETIVPKGSVHIAVRTMLMSVYFRWKGDFAPDKMSDEQRFQWVVDWDKEKAVQAGREAYIDANPKKLLDLWEGIKRKYQGERQEQRDKREEESRQTNPFNTPGCISYQINPKRFIVGTLDSKIAEVEYKTVVDKFTNEAEIKVQQLRTFTACKPVKIIRHINPLPFLEAQDRYTIEFKGMEPSGCFTLRHKTLAEIIAILKNGNALTEKGIDVAIQAQIKGFEQAKLIEVNDNMDFTGFFPVDNNKKIISSNIKIPEIFPDVTDALNFIEELLPYYKNREELLSHVLLWFMIAPLSFIFKIIKAPLLYWVHLDGPPNTGKSSSGEIGLAIDGNETNIDFILNINHIDNTVRFGETVHGTTFPKLLDEVNIIDRQDIVKNIVTAVDVVKFRKILDKNRITEYITSMAPLFLTSNDPTPTNPEYLKRVKTRNFPDKEVHSQTSLESIEYKKWLSVNLSRCRALGHARNKLVMESNEFQKIILDATLTPFDKSRKIWDTIYKSIGRELPDFFSKNLDETQMLDAIENKKGDILGALESWIIDRCRSLDTNRGEYGIGQGEKKILDKYPETIDRLVELIDRKLITCVRKDRDDRIVFSRQIIIELERFGIRRIDLHSLEDTIPGAAYMKSDGCKVVKCSVDDLKRFFSKSD